MSPLPRRRPLRKVACALTVAIVALVGARSLADARPPRAQAAHRDAVPILMYHVISHPPAGAPYPDLYVARRDFELQMRWLARHGFHAVTLRRVYDYWTKGAGLPANPVVITFDDGYRSVYSAALPVLRTLQWPGVVNLKIDNTKDRWGLPPELVRRLIAARWEIDAHTITHPDLTAVDDDRLRREVSGSRTFIRRTFHIAADFFCYPSGRYDRRVIAAVRGAGYLGATTTEFGLGRPSELFTLDRIRINGGDGVAGFAAKLSR